MGVVDVDPGSKSYGNMVGQVDMPNAGDELHHFGWNACSSCLCPYSPHPHIERRYLVVPGLPSSRIHILDTKPDRRKPKVVKVIEAETLTNRTGYRRPVADRTADARPVQAHRPKQHVILDQQKAAQHGITDEEVGRVLRMASAGYSPGLLHVPSEKEDIPITLRLSRASRSNPEQMLLLKVQGRDGSLIPLREIVRVVDTIEDKSIYHKNLMPVTYVAADVAGSMKSPAYVILKLGPEILKMHIPEGYEIEQYTAGLPATASKYAMKWDGEWHITYEMFRDLGVAFAAVIVLIYILVVGWFKSFITPLVILTAIPFSLIGVLPAHGLLHAYFTATSMIGFIAGAGIVVRNSIILVDFIELRLKEWRPLKEAVVDAGAARFRPMMLTAAAMVVGSTVILFDPIFRGWRLP